MPLLILMLLLCLPGRAELPADQPMDEVLTRTVRATPEQRASVSSALHHHAEGLARDLGQAAPGSVADWSAVLGARVAERLEDRHAAGLTTSAEQARGIVLDFEAYKVRGYLGSGVYPRRYFGYLDAVGDTAAEELRVVRTIRTCTDVANAWLAEQGIDWRVTDQEIAVTWIAEGGALLLKDRTAAHQPIHPILGIGLDDIAHGFQELPGLVGRMDTAAGTGVERIPEWEQGGWRLTRYMSLEESVVGTAIMWVWEKRIAERKLRAAGRPAMHTYDRTDQFLLASLVYNSGLIHAPGRAAQVRAWTLAPHLSALAARHNPTRRHAHLPVESSEQTAARLLIDRDYPYQGTSWIALYHIQQRYGGYEALERFTDTFDGEGRLVMAPWETLEARLAEQAEVEQRAEEASRRRAGEARQAEARAREEARQACGGCDSGGSVGWMAWVLAALVVRRRHQPQSGTPSKSSV